jgi:hypothetical protein
MRDSRSFTTPIKIASAWRGSTRESVVALISTAYAEVLKSLLVHYSLQVRCSHQHLMFILVSAKLLQF